MNFALILVHPNESLASHQGNIDYKLNQIFFLSFYISIHGDKMDLNICFPPLLNI